MRAPLLLPVLMLAGCAWEPGAGFAALEATMNAKYAPEGSRERGLGYQQLASSYQIQVTGATMQLERIELIGRAASTGPSRFDPANPPPGYTLCHGGHCHRDDGALIPYEDIEAELSGGGATATPVATLPVGELNLLAPVPRTLGCEPDCELPRTEVTRARWAVTTLRLAGTVRDSLTTPRFPGNRLFQLELATTGTASPVAVLEGDLDVPSDREHAPRVLMHLQLDIPSRIFDEVDWAATTPGADGTVDLGAEANAAARAEILEYLSGVKPTAEVTREDR
ncbi:hypothetical protein [Hyalangium rubrum]|uniref:Lipoprotein n=1 Tax=Hyalangium rubrum TaxID=3103134 RepID=A0ABU5GUH1_9BACT|nr:hypothetical protein [Hyalangium sp. s54d21]MDY7224839.1 hypothetical protein [Hyalangium sp. s54d21]